MEIDIKGRSCSLSFGFKPFLLFEGVSGGRSFDGTSLTDEIMMMLCCIVAGDPNLSLDVDDLVLVLDANPELLSAWRKWFGGHVDRQAQRMRAADLDTDSKKKE